MFAGETLGVPEDAATGSASGPLGAYVAERGVLNLNDPIEIVSLQGKRMGRPSTIRIRLDLHDGHATNITFGGGVAPVLEGELTLPDWGLDLSQRLEEITRVTETGGGVLATSRVRAITRGCVGVVASSGIHVVAVVNTRNDAPRAGAPRPMRPMPASPV